MVHLDDDGRLGDEPVPVGAAGLEAGLAVVLKGGEAFAVKPPIHGPGRLVQPVQRPAESTRHVRLDFSAV